MLTLESASDWQSRGAEGIGAATPNLGNLILAWKDRPPPKGATGKSLRGTPMMGLETPRPKVRETGPAGRRRCDATAISDHPREGRSRAHRAALRATP